MHQKKKNQKPLANSNVFVCVCVCVCVRACVLACVRACVFFQHLKSREPIRTPPFFFHFTQTPYIFFVFILFRPHTVFRSVLPPPFVFSFAGADMFVYCHFFFLQALPRDVDKNSIIPLTQPVYPEDLESP